MIGVLLQVRLDSSRLPRKALLKLENLTVIEHAMRSLKKVNADKFIVVTTEDSFEELSPLADKWGFDIFVGSKENVLERFVKAIKKFNLTKIIRATGDNPLVSWELANLLLKQHNTQGFQYSGFLNSPIGTGVEIVNSDLLFKALDESTNNYDKEHVTPFIYNNKNLFNIFQNDAPKKYLLEKSYVTIDTREDFNRIEKLFHELYHGEIIPIESVIKWLKKEQ